ncbi:cytochrome c, partial [Paenibacillus sp. TAF58]
MKKVKILKRGGFIRFMFKKTPVLLLALAIFGSLTACEKRAETPSESLNPSGETRTAKPSVPTSSPENVGQANQGNPSPRESISAAPTTAALDAAVIFKQNCIACHGAELEGRMIGPNLQKVGARLSKEKIINQITNGNT